MKKDAKGRTIRVENRGGKVSAVRARSGTVFDLRGGELKSTHYLEQRKKGEGGRKSQMHVFLLKNPMKQYSNTRSRSNLQKGRTKKGKHEIGGRGEKKGRVNTWAPNGNVPHAKYLLWIRDDMKGPSSGEVLRKKGDKYGILELLHIKEYTRGTYRITSSEKEELGYRGKTKKEKDKVEVKKVEHSSSRGKVSSNVSF